MSARDRSGDEAGLRSGGVMSGRAAFLWVVEMFEAGAWVPTCGVALTRAMGRIEIKQWRESDPDDEFRLRRYMREVSRCGSR